MNTQPLTQQVLWQDLKVRSELDTVLDIAHQKGWADCGVFGHGAMISEPQELKGWKLIPADQYEYSIPAEAVSRVIHVINAGIHIQGVIIADDERKKPPSKAPARRALLLQRTKAVLSSVGKTLLGLVLVAGGFALAALFVALFALMLLKFPALLLLSPLILFSGNTEYDPKLIILVEDGSGGTVWVCLYTWYE